MYLFFMISGLLFVIGLSLVLNYLYELFSINKLTTFLSPIENTTFNQVGITIIPNILWSLIEVTMLGTNHYFLLGFFLNIFVSMSVIYVIKYGYQLITKNISNFINVMSIIIGTIFGFSVNYLSLLTGTKQELNLKSSIIGILIFIVFFIVIKIFPPKSNFFREIKE